MIALKKCEYFEKEEFPLIVSLMDISTGIWLNRPKSQNLTFSSRRREGMKHRNFISGGQNLFQPILKYYYSDYDRDIAIPLQTDINSFNVH